jgi:hypothetical protein
MPALFANPASESDIEFLEKKYSIKLDNGLKNFYIKYNGIFIARDSELDRIGDDYVNIEFNKIYHGYISLLGLYGLNSSNENFNIFNINDSFLNEITSLQMPLIIGDTWSDFYVTGYWKNKFGIFYWDRSFSYLLPDDKPDIEAASENEGAYYLVAEDFDSFWKLLTPSLDKMKFIKQEDWPNSHSLFQMD